MASLLSIILSGIFTLFLPSFVTIWALWTTARHQTSGYTLYHFSASCKSCHWIWYPPHKYVCVYIYMDIAISSCGPLSLWYKARETCIKYKYSAKWKWYLKHTFPKKIFSHFYISNRNRIAMPKRGGDGVSP